MSSITPKSAVSSLKYDKNIGNEQDLFHHRYQIRKELGKGKYGKVFLARDVSQGISSDKQKQRVAIKIISHCENNADDFMENTVFQKIYDLQKGNQKHTKGLPLIIDHGVNMDTM